MATSAVERVEVGVGDCFRRLYRRAAAKNGEPRETGLLVPGEQLVAPVDRRAQRLVACGRVTHARTQRTEHRLKTLRDLGRRQQLTAGCGKFDRQRQPIDTPADRRDRGVAGVAQLELRIVRPCALREQRDGVPVRRRPATGTAVSSYGERRNGVALLGVQGERLAAGREHDDARTGPKHAAYEGCRPQHVLAVVHHEQQMLARQKAFDRLLGRFAGERHDAKRADDRRGNLLRPLQSGERHEARPIGEVPRRAARGLNRESRLAHTSRPGERQQPDRSGLQPVADRPELARATDCPIRRRGQRADPGKLGGVVGAAIEGSCARTAS